MPIELGSFSIGVVAGGMVVGVINHILAKSRDTESRSAQEFNAAAVTLAEILTRERSDPSPSGDIDFVPFSLVLNEKELRRFRKCVEGYEHAKNSAQIDHYNDDTICIIGSGRYHDTTPIIAAIDSLLKFTKRK